MSAPESLSKMRSWHRPLSLALLVAACSGGGGGNSTPTTPTSVLTSIAITASAQSVIVGQTLQLAAAPKDQSGNAFAATVAWSSSAPSVAGVSGTGLVTALTAGSTTITATASAGSVTVSSSTQITVTAPVLASVTISAPATSVTAGGTVQLTASPKDQNGNAIAATVTWSSSAPAIASVVASSGLVSAVAAGSATITASAAAGGTTVTATVQLTVTAQAPSPVLTSVTISGASTVAAGSTLPLTASALDQNGSAISASVTWSSSATGVATVSPAAGLTTTVSGVSAGTATITAQAVAGGVTKTSNLLVSVTSAFPVTATVTATDFNSFTPGSVDIARGGSVSFVFQSVTHNVTFNGGAGAPPNIGNTASATVQATFNTAGSFGYQCTIHPGMIGTVVVH